MSLNKRGFEFSFAWLFAIIVGAIILFLAIYGVTKIIRVEQTVINAEVGGEIGILLNPLETGFESAKSVSFTIPGETRIFNKCYEKGNFGKQIIPISQKSFGEWSETNLKESFSNKYIFSEEYVEGRKFYVFSKPFKFPFKVADLIYLSSARDEYCFFDAPQEIEEELLHLNQQNLKLEGNCSNKTHINVCFDDFKCDIYVNLEQNYVKKNKEKIYFIIPEKNIFGDKDYSLMYAAIFSNKEIYECQLIRLMKRLEQLSEIYIDKAEFVSRVGCNTNLNLELLKEAADNYNNPTQLNSILEIVKDIEEKNADAECKLW